MIKAEDLRIGDLVIVNENCSLEQGTIGKVSEVRSTPLYKEKEGSIGLKPISNDRWPWGVLCHNIDPIPLTPEILKKNEFDYLNEEVVTYNKRIHRGTILVLRPYGKVFDVIIKRNWHARDCHIRYIEYIHELQHLLWALGRNANLKI